jgi:hypothetical protein
MRDLKQLLSLVAYHAKIIPPRGWAFAPLVLFSILLSGGVFGDRGGSHAAYIAYETGAPTFIFFIFLLTFLLLLSDSLTMKPDADAAMLAFPLTRAIEKRLYIRARLVLVGGLLALPCLISLIYSFNRPALKLRLGFSNQEVLEYWTAEPSQARGGHQARQLLYLERLSQSKAVDVPTSEEIQRHSRERPNTFHPRGTLHIKNGLRDRNLALTAVTGLVFAGTAYCLCLCVARIRGDNAMLAGSAPMCAWMLFAWLGPALKLYDSSLFYDRMLVEFLRSPWLWFGASIFVSLILLRLAEKAWLRKEAIKWTNQQHRERAHSSISSGS